MTSTLLSPQTINFCPVCGALATMPHHIRPLVIGGRDTPSNICLVCSGCRASIQEIQGERDLSPGILEDVRKKLGIKLKADHDGIAETYKVFTEEDGTIVEILLWIIMPSGTKREICQKVGILGKEKPREELDYVIPPIQARRPAGRPSIGVSNNLLQELVSQGLSLRQVSRALETNGIDMSYATIAHRLSKLRREP